MRLWSLHPKYLDSKGLVAVWREALLAQKVLKGETDSYKNHPQLQRFKSQRNPVAAIASYLQVIFLESVNRDYHFDPARIATERIEYRIPVTLGQIRYEWSHLMGKLLVRDPQRYRALENVIEPIEHPVFMIVPGGIEPWEAIPKK